MSGQFIIDWSKLIIQNVHEMYPTLDPKTNYQHQHIFVINN